MWLEEKSSLMVADCLAIQKKHGMIADFKRTQSYISTVGVAHLSFSVDVLYWNFMPTITLMIS